MGARCYKVGINSFVADNIFFLSNDVNDEMPMLLSSPCDNMTQSEIGVLEEFDVIMYDRSSSTNKVNDASLDLFARKQRPYNGIPPSRAALVEHIKRSVLQAGHTWGQSLCKSPTLPSPSRSHP
jgi:hypothetical protein